MKILFYGYNGWIGNQLYNLLKKEIKNKNYNLIIGKCRLEDYNNLLNEIENIEPDRIITTTGRTYGDDINSIDYLEDKLDINVRDNLYGPLNLQKICEKLNIHLTYFGTGCIYSNDNNNYEYTEEDKPNFFGSSYSIIKGFTNDYLQNCKNILHIRIRMPINSENHPRNFITKLLTYENICSMYNSMTILPDLLPIAIDLCIKKHCGTINLVNPGFISHNEILELYKQIVDPDFTWNNFSIDEQNALLQSRRSNNYLSTNKLLSLYPDIPSIKISIQNILKNYPKPEKIDNILVTGGCGFIGSNFINFILEKNNNINIVNIDAMYYCSNENNISKKFRDLNNYKLIKGNLNELKLINILKENNIKYVINFAAQSHVCTSFTNSLQYTKDNILGSHNLLEACKNYNKLIKFIHISTDEVYGESIHNIKSENSVLNPTNPYAATKAGIELIIQSYITSYKFPAIIVRSNNVYGNNQYPEKLIPKFIKLLKENKKLSIHGTGESLRAFVHINDYCNAINILLKKGKLNEIYNISSLDEYSVSNIAKLLVDIIKKNKDYAKYIEYVEDRPFNDKRYFINSKKLEQLGWKIETNFKEELTKLALSEH